ncbi:hypothetical protein GCM10022277_12830 [Litoribacillus peritrichatus]|uniref:Uncharacterized protein n=1 Tax=Litoribacillus peritrichatus TaxID=718191 RepID=A0ABP7MB19_9GAMM
MAVAYSIGMIELLASDSGLSLLGGVLVFVKRCKLSEVFSIVVSDSEFISV